MSAFPDGASVDVARVPVTPAWPQVVAASLAIAVFLLDAFTTQALAMAVLYVLVLLTGALGDPANRRRRIIRWYATCLVLSVAGFAIFETRGAPPLAIAHLGISITVLSATTFLLLHANAMDTAVRLGERRYRNIFDTVSMAIWEHDFTPVVDEIRRLRAAGVEDLRRHVEDNPQFVVAMRRRVRITDVNAAALKMMGVAARENFFPHLSDFLPESDESFAECILALDERRALFQAETMVLPPGGEPRQIIVSFGLGPDACLERVPGSILDVTGRKALEGQIARARTDLADAQRSGALAAMSASIAHELNQPMSAIQSYADAARRWMSRSPPDPEEATAALVGLAHAVEHARTVMHRVRSLVGNARLDFGRIDLRELLTTTIAMQEGDAGARVLLASDSDDAVMVNGDRILLKQVFVNLITNAVQAMDGIPAERRVVTLALERNRDDVVVRVSDRGPGWDPSSVSKVFGSFYTTKEHGMGLGLSISRTTIERHGGTIELGPADGGGASVEVTLPLDGTQPVAGDCHDRRVQEVAVEGLFQ